MNEQCDMLVLSYKEYREHDVLICGLSEQGKINLIARGANKGNSKNAGAIQPYSLARILYNAHEQRSLYTLKTAQGLKSRRHLREHLLLSAIASLICEIVVSQTMDEGSEYFKIVDTCLDALEKGTQPYGVLCLFLALHLRMQGIYPEVEGCVRCGSREHIQGISICDGGFVCHSCYRCEDDRKRTREQLKKFRLINHAAIEHLPIIDDSASWDYEDADILLSLLSEYGNAALKSAIFLKNISKFTY